MCYAFVLLNDLKAHNKLKSNKQPSLFSRYQTRTIVMYTATTAKKEDGE